MVEGASWFGAALLPQGLYSLLSSTKKCIPKFIKTFCRRLLGYLSANWSSTEVGWCNRTTIQNTDVNQQQNGFNRRKYAFWSGPVRVLTSTGQRCCCMTSRAVHTSHPKNIAELKQFCKENPKCRSYPQLQKMFGWGYCCQKRVNQLLNPRLHIHFPPCTVNVYTCVFKKDMKTYNCLCY